MALHPVQLIYTPLILVYAHLGYVPSVALSSPGLPGPAPVFIYGKSWGLAPSRSRELDARFPFTTRSDSGSAPGISQVQRSPKERSKTSLDNYYWCGTRRGVLWFNGVVMAIGRARRFFGRISCIPRHHQHLPLAACGEQRPVLLQLAALPVA